MTSALEYIVRSHKLSPTQDDEYPSSKLRTLHLHRAIDGSPFADPPGQLVSISPVNWILPYTSHGSIEPRSTCLTSFGRAS